MRLSCGVGLFSWGKGGELELMVPVVSSSSYGVAVRAEVHSAGIVPVVGSSSNGVAS